MEVTKRSYLLLDGAGDNNALFFFLRVGMGWNRSPDGIARRMESLVGMESLVLTGWNHLSDGIACPLLSLTPSLLH